MQTFARKSVTALLASAVFSSSALAGTDTVVQFVNMSPHNVTVSFPTGDSHCWHDEYPSDSRIDDYFGYVRNNQTSESGYQSYLLAFKEAYGQGNLGALPRHDMRGTSATLAPATSGTTVSSTLFMGETSAAVNPFGDNCKLRTAWRGFQVTLKDDAGKTLSNHRYVLSDPPDSQWTLSRSQPGNPGQIVDTIMLGAGGHGNPVEIAIATVITVATVATLGTATAELVAARFGVAALEESLQVASWLVTEEISTTLTARQVAAGMFRYLFVGNLGFTGFSWEAVGALATRTFVGRVLTVTLADGVLYLGTRSQDGKDIIRLPNGARLAPVLTQQDYDNPKLSMNQNLAEQDDRAVCTYATRTLGLVTECRVVGVQLAVQPDGSLSFLPLPAVGSGT